MRTIVLALVMSSLAVHAEPFRVGTFDNRAVALAFYNSDDWAGVLKAKLGERESAKKAGNDERVRELEKWGQEQQDLAHKQVFDSAPITNVLEYLAPAFADIARSAGVAVIVSGVQYTDSTVQKVDVTPQILDALKATARTREMIKRLSDSPHKH